MIRIHIDDGSARSFSGDPPITIGRGAECEVRLNDEAVSRRHLVIQREGRDLVAVDQNSRNGTFLHGPDSRIERAILRSGDLLIAGRTRLRVEFESYDEVAPAATPAIRFHILSPPAAAGVVESDKESITLGRHPTCDVMLPDPTVSRRHAIIARTPAGFVINDQNSVNAVLAGNPPVRVTSALLRDGDEIQLGTARLRVEIPSEFELTEVEEETPLPLEPLVRLSPPYPPRADLQPHLARMPLFRGFRRDDWDAFFNAYERDRAIRVLRFAPGGVISESGKFDLAFCLILSGNVDVHAGGNGGGPLARLGDGEFYGLIEAKRALPRATTMIAATEVDLLHVPRHFIRFIEHNAAARALLAARYKEEAWRVMAAQLELFAGVDPRAVAELIERSEIEFYDKAGAVIVQQGTPGDSFYVVRDGFVQVVQQRDDATRRVLAYLRPGEFFGEMALLDDVPRQASVITAGKAELVKISRADFHELCMRHPEVERQVRALTEKRRIAGHQITPELSGRLEHWGQGYLQADALLVMDLELCVKCDLCVEACETLHGESRLVRSGMQLGKYLVPSACRHCDDPLCMFACPTGAVNRRPEGEIFIQYDVCVGCGACAIACPYDNITMIETNKFDRAQARKQRILPEQEFFRPLPVVNQSGTGRRLWSRRASGESDDPDHGAVADEQTQSVPPRYPIKCDLCDGLPFMGCVHACPTGAAIRLDPRTVFEETGAVSVGSRINKARGA